MEASDQEIAEPYKIQQTGLTHLWRCASAAMAWPKTDP